MSSTLHEIKRYAAGQRIAITAAAMVTAASGKKWIQDVAKKMEEKGTKGALHRYLGVPENETIPKALLEKTLKDPKISETTRKRVMFALNMAKVGKHVKSGKPVTAMATIVPPLSQWEVKHKRDFVAYHWKFGIPSAREKVAKPWQVVITDTQNQFDPINGFLVEVDFLGHEKSYAKYLSKLGNLEPYNERDAKLFAFEDEDAAHKAFVKFLKQNPTFATQFTATAGVEAKMFGGDLKTTTLQAVALSIYKSFNKNGLGNINQTATLKGEDAHWTATIRKPEAVVPGAVGIEIKCKQETGSAGLPESFEIELRITFPNGTAKWFTVTEASASQLPEPKRTMGAFLYANVSDIAKFLQGYARKYGSKTATAAESKDTEAPYSRKRNLASLNNARLSKVWKFLSMSGLPQDIDALIATSKTWDTATAKDKIVRLSGVLDSKNEMLGDIQDIVTLVGVHSGMYGSLARAMRMGVETDFARTTPTQLLINLKGMLKSHRALRAKVLAEARKRGVDEAKLDAWSRKQTGSGYVAVSALGDTDTVKVAYRRVRKDNEIIAVFPEQVGRNGKVTIFTLDDEHAEVTPAWVRGSTVPAKPEEYRKLQSVVANRYPKQVVVPTTVLFQLLKDQKVTASANVWVMKSDKGQKQGTDPKAVLEAFVKEFGSRGSKFRLSENRVEGDNLVFTSGCRLFKGTIKEIQEQLKTVTAAQGDAASFTQGGSSSPERKKMRAELLNLGYEGDVFDIYMRSRLTKIGDFARVFPDAFRKDVWSIHFIKPKVSGGESEATIAGLRSKLKSGLSIVRHPITQALQVVDPVKYIKQMTAAGWVTDNKDTYSGKPAEVTARFGDIFITYIPANDMYVCTRNNRLFSFGERDLSFFNKSYMERELEQRGLHRDPRTGKITVVKPVTAAASSSSIQLKVTCLGNYEPEEVGEYVTKTLATKGVDVSDFRYRDDSVLLTVTCQTEAQADRCGQLLAQAFATPVDQKRFGKVMANAFAKGNNVILSADALGVRQARPLYI